ncbi:DUF2949 domain-containing protein [Neosynechococcus sphagnicola]|uniref:DUF2949 domain-containing protein n=1 Tax=Neosynechococcus sphagnicola TaxID=1501145 RepID=UPI00056B7990
MNVNTQLIQFLRHDLAVSSTEIDIMLRHCERENAPLPMLLWKYGLVSLQQLGQIFDWLEAQTNSALDGVFDGVLAAQPSSVLVQTSVVNHPFPLQNFQPEAYSRPNSI